MPKRPVPRRDKRVRFSDPEPVFPYRSTPVPQPSTFNGRRVFDLEYFRNFPLTNHYTQHNIALKWYREEGERMKALAVCFWHEHAYPVPRIVKTGGPAWGWDFSVYNPWRWQELVAQLDESSMQYVVEGPDNGSRGLTSCKLIETKRYDHKRHANAKELIAKKGGWPHDVHLGQTRTRPFLALA